MGSDENRIREIDEAVQRDVTAVPIPRARMGLLWLDPHQLQEARHGLGRGERIGFVAASAADAETGHVRARLREAFDRNEIGTADLDWALHVDAIAEQAVLLSGYAPLGAIEKYREALALAPGCDLYLMSMGTLFATLGFYRQALRYFERAAELNPDSPRIARNLAACRSYL